MLKAQSRVSNTSKKISKNKTKNNLTKSKSSSLSQSPPITPTKPGPSLLSTHSRQFTTSSIRLNHHLKTKGVLSCTITLNKSSSQQQHKQHKKTPFTQSNRTKIDHTIPINISLAPPTLTPVDNINQNTPTPHPPRENPTERKLQWLNKRLHSPPAAKVRDEDIPDTIPNLNDDKSSFFSPQGYSYHFNEELQAKITPTTKNPTLANNIHMTQARIDSLERELKLKAKENNDQEDNDELLSSSLSSSSTSTTTKKNNRKRQLNRLDPHELHGSLGDEIEPPDNLGVEMDNRPDPEAKEMFDKIHQAKEEEEQQQHSLNNTLKKKKIKYDQGDDNDNNDHAEEDLKHCQSIGPDLDNNNDNDNDNNDNEEHSQQPKQSKLDKLFRYEDAEDSFLYESIDPFAGRDEKRKKNLERNEQLTLNRQQTLEERKAELDRTKEAGEAIAQALDFEPLHHEIANEVLSRQSLASYIMSKKAEILPPQARPVFWHGFTPYTDSHGTLTPGLDNLKQETPDLDWRTFLDFSQPHLWYPTARLLKRKIIFHTGPTNSGKTHRAMQRLKEAEKGLYSAPLRLLAYQNQEYLMQHGIPCSLLTGQEVVEVPNAQHVSSTVEMISLERVVDVAVIDEIQMIQDRDRGFAWTRAVLGVPAKEVHVCGDATALGWLQEITAMTGEELHVHEYKRLSPLTVETEPLAGYQNLRKGDCVVAFSRRDVYSLKKKIEEFTGKRCAIIYGSLPPEIRKQQAKYFNEGELDILVASDAIGMGLNLNIGRVVFSSILKFDGQEFRRLQQTEVLQIAGRAGRFNTQFHHGFVNVMHVPEDLEYVREQFQTPLPPMKKAQLFPSTEHLLAFCEKFPKIKLSNYLNALPTRAKVSNLFEICDPSTMSLLAEAIDDIEMPAYNRVMLCYAPLSLERYKTHRALLQELALKLTQDAPIPIPKITYASRPVMPQTPEEVALLEETFTNLEAYIWLWYRLGDQLYSHRQAKIDKESCQKIILHYLQNS